MMFVNSFREALLSLCTRKLNSHRWERDKAMKDARFWRRFGVTQQARNHIAHARSHGHTIARIVAKERAILSMPSLEEDGHGESFRRREKTIRNAMASANPLVVEALETLLVVTTLAHGEGQTPVRVELVTASEPEIYRDDTQIIGTFSTAEEADAFVRKYNEEHSAEMVIAESRISRYARIEPDYSPF